MYHQTRERPVKCWVVVAFVLVQLCAQPTDAGLDNCAAAIRVSEVGATILEPLRMPRSAQELQDHIAYVRPERGSEGLRHRRP